MGATIDELKDETMRNKKSIEEVASIVESEGLGHAVADYMGAESIEDEELARLWREASAVLFKIQSILDPYME